MRAPARGQPGHRRRDDALSGGGEGSGSEGTDGALARLQGVQPLAAALREELSGDRALALARPILPFLDLMVELFCCWVMPDTFGRYQVADFDESQSQEPETRFQIGTAREGTDVLQAFDALGAVGDLFGKFLNFKDVAGRLNVGPGGRSHEDRRRARQEVEAALRADDIEVRREPYDPGSREPPLRLRRLPPLAEARAAR